MLVETANRYRVNCFAACRVLSGRLVVFASGYCLHVFISPAAADRRQDDALR
jgi:hypothetical protein